MFYTKNPIQYPNISVYIYLNTTVLSFQSLKKLEIVLLQESAKNRWVAIFTAPKNGC